MFQILCLIYNVISFFGASVIILRILWRIVTGIQRNFLNYEVIRSNGKAVLITGCDSGFGNRTAIKLTELGFRVYATVLDLNSVGSQQLIVSSKCGNNRMKVIKMDVTNNAEVNNAYEVVCEDLGNNCCHLWGLVNNAGITCAGLPEWGSLDSYRSIFEVNTFGLVKVTRTFLPLIRKSKGRIVNISSFGARYTVKEFTPYCMSKSAVNSFTNSLRRELSKWDIKVSLIEATGFKTEMTKISSFHNTIDKEWMTTTEHVKQIYGQKYFEIFREKWPEFLNRIMYSNLDLVADSIIDAIRTQSPRINYIPSGDWLTPINILFLDNIPKEWLDNIICRIDRSLLIDKTNK